MKPIIYKTKPRINGLTIVDAYNGSIKELFYLNNPKQKKEGIETKKLLENFIQKNKIPACWIYFKQEKILVHTVQEADYFKLRTARNKNLITEKEQSKFRNLTVGIAGLSVGSCIVSSIVSSGGPKNIKLADFDVIELTNLNRIKASILDIGKNKIEIAAREIWKLDPFANLFLFQNGINEKKIKKFLLQKPKLDVFIDEMDNISLKIKSRFLCKKNRIPVIMATDNGDSVILDIERYDTEPNRKIFHGLLPEIKEGSVIKLDYKQWLSLTTKIIGPEFLTSAMQNSLLEIGRSISAVPQLGTTANLAGSAICLALRRIANGYSMPSGRYVISLEEKLISNFNSPKSIKIRESQTKNFKRNFGIYNE